MRRLLRPGTLLLGSFLFALPGPRVAAQAPLPGSTLTPETLLSYCAEQGAGQAAGEAAGEEPSGCKLLLTGQQTLALHGDWQLPRTVHLRFAPGSALHIAGGVLGFAGGSVEAPDRTPIFPDGDRVRGLAAGRPEWFAKAPGQDQAPAPAADLAAAYAATEPWGTVYLRKRTYLSPFTNCSSDFPRYLSPRTLVGAGRPSPDDPIHPNHLQGGTSLLGGIFGTAPIRLAHLGVDAGPDVSTHLLHGCREPAIFIEQPGHEFVSGDRLEDVSVLTTDAFNMHSVMIAGHREAVVRGLWIWTLGGTHGLVMKSSHSEVDGLHCWGAVSDCLILKSDYATDFLGRAVQDRIAHVDIHPLQPGGSVGGIVVDSRWDTVHALELEDISETGTHFGIVLLGSSFFRPREIAISRWNADAVTGTCLFSYKADAVRVSDFHCSLKPEAEAGAVLRRSRDTLLQRGVFQCEGTPVQCAAGHTDGVLDDAARLSLRQIVAEGLGGYLLHGRHPAPPQREVLARDMAGRIWAPYSVSLADRLREVLAQAKPDLRILYTFVATRVMFRPWLYATLAALILCTLAGEIVHRRRRSTVRERLRPA